MGRRKKYRKDTTNVHPLFSGDDEYVEELLEAAHAKRQASEPPYVPKYGPRDNVRLPWGVWWRKLTRDQWVELFPADPPALRTIAGGLAALGDDVVTFTQRERDSKQAPMRQLARVCGVSPRTLCRYLPLFEAYGVIEVKRWQRRIDRSLGVPSLSIRVFRGAAIPENWSWEGGNFPVSARQAA